MRFCPMSPPPCERTPAPLRSTAARKGSGAPPHAAVGASAGMVHWLNCPANKFAGGCQKQPGAAPISPGTRAGMPCVETACVGTIAGDKERCGPRPGATAPGATSTGTTKGGITAEAPEGGTTPRMGGDGGAGTTSTGISLTLLFGMSAALVGEGHPLHPDPVSEVARAGCGCSEARGDGDVDVPVCSGAAILSVARGGDRDTAKRLGVLIAIRPASKTAA